MSFALSSSVLHRTMEKMPNTRQSRTGKRVEQATTVANLTFYFVKVRRYGQFKINQALLCQVPKCCIFTLFRSTASRSSLSLDVIQFHVFWNKSRNPLVLWGWNGIKLCCAFQSCVSVLSPRPSIRWSSPGTWKPWSGWSTVEPIQARRNRLWVLIPLYLISADKRHVRD